MPKTVVFGLIRSIHDLLTAVWIGGMVATALALLPALKGKFINENQRAEIMVRYQKVMSVAAIVSFAGLWITGVLLGRQSGQAGALLNFSTQPATLLSIKHILVLVMIVLALVRRFGLGRRIATFTPKDRKAYALILVVNAVIGVAVIFLSAFSAAL